MSDAAGAAAAAGSDGAAAANNDAAAGAAGATEAAAWTAPDWVPEAARGKDVAETFEKFGAHYQEEVKRFNGMREKIANMPKAPEKPENYTFAPADEIKAYFGDDNAEVVNAAKAAFHKHGIPDAAFSAIINDIYLPMAKAGALPQPFDAKAELATFATLTGLDAPKASAAYVEASTYAEGLAKELSANVPEAQRAAIEAQVASLTDTAAGTVLLRHFMAMGRDNGIAMGGTGAGSAAMTFAEAQKAVSDPRYSTKNKDHADAAKRFDPAFRAKVDAAIAAEDRRRSGG